MFTKQRKAILALAVVFGFLSFLPVSRALEIPTMEFRQKISEGIDTPAGVTIAEDFTIYVVDTGKKAILVFDQKNKLIAQITSSHLIDPWSIDISRLSNELYVTDRGTASVKVFNRQGSFLREIGSKGTGDGQLQKPGDIAVDDEGNIYVVDLAQRKIISFTSDGTLRYQLKDSGNKEWKFNEPFGICVLKKDVIYVSDRGNNQIQVFSDRTFLHTLDAPDGTLAAPAGISVDPLNRTVYVVNAGKCEIAFFGPDGSYFKSRSAAFYGNASQEIEQLLFSDIEGRLYAVTDVKSKSVYLFTISYLISEEPAVVGPPEPGQPGQPGEAGPPAPGAAAPGAAPGP